MPRRRYRLFIFCSVVILFMLYRVSQNSQDAPPSYSDLYTNFEPEEYDSEHVERPQALPPGQEPPIIPVEDFAHVEIPELNKHGAPKSDEGLADSVLKKGGNPPPGLPKDADSPSIPVVVPAKVEEKIHWVKQPEHYPVPPEQIAKLPLGSPKDIPKIQYDFKAESGEAKAKREARLKLVRKEIERSWSGYRKHAWMQDELSPMSGENRNPFCGWAATLVDSLDTLWIAGLKDEFDEAAKAVKDIDFTFTTRNEIPVFETTIRYLGGLLAAYDVSGGAQGSYSILLEKATELAEILMGIFDTPNRMPLLYYDWRPSEASQKRRADNVGIAELATLSMEFTRLAQLTGVHKYYDAIDRITNALIKMQLDKDVSIPGLFPQGLDASGCERIERPTADGGDASKSSKAPSPVVKRAVEDATVAEPAQVYGEGATYDCKDQGLLPAGFGGASYSMGGSQDSAYEYFPKEYLLLGGLESKYQKLHEETVSAVDRALMFRPMIKDQDKWDILFPAKVQAWDYDPKNRVPTYEMTHLTCFIGGMYGLGAKIYNRPQDLETAKKLTDGCVWGYQVTESGLMPEAAQLVPCPTLDKCEFNETLWHDELDTSADWRDAEVAKWDAKEAQRKLAEQQVAGAGYDAQSVPGLGQTVSEADQAAEALKQKALGVETQAKAVEQSAGTRDQNVHAKRAAIPVEDGESQLPDSLKGKLQAGEAGEKSATTAPDATYNSVAESVPGQALPQKAWSEVVRERPSTHEEYVKSRIEDEHLPPGFVDVMAGSYILRPEAIESVWYMYRITGDTTWQDKGWTMFEAITRHTQTKLANAAVDNVMSAEPTQKDEMESFWLAETLKYFYLLYSEPHVISLDEWVLNTEAHPFRRPM